MPRALEADPIVVFGAPRSGTTYVQQILNAHPEVFVSHESRLFAWLHQALTVLTQDRALLLSHGDEFVKHLRAVFPQVIRDFYDDLAPDARFWGDKYPRYSNPVNAGLLELVVELFPGARFIHVIRDGRDVVSSLVRKRGDDGKPWATFDEAHELWPSCTDHGSAFGRPLGADQYLELFYEDLVADDLAGGRRLFGFIGLDFHAAVDAFCRSEQSARSPFSGPTRDLSEGVTASDWSTVFAPEEQARSLELLGAQLVRYGYETEESLGRLEEQIAGSLSAQEGAAAVAPSPS
jgi:hypothetical protein